MSYIKLLPALAFLFVISPTKAQDTKNDKKPVKAKPIRNLVNKLVGADFTISSGVASYYGDLTENEKFINQPSFAFSIGYSYHFYPQIKFRTEFSFLQLQANDNKNTRPDLVARNLNFKSNVWSIDAEMEYELIKTSATNKFTPYIFHGFGVLHFNPYTTDRKGVKRFLEPYGTEGQGLIGYPGRKKYDLFAAQIPFGIGFKLEVSRSVALQMEFKYRYTFTDYLDDVSLSGYPDKALLDAVDPITSTLTYRGDELSGGKPYPAISLPRGNPTKKDVYYSTEIKMAYHLFKKK